jgi:hypothetical protein
MFLQVKYFQVFLFFLFRFVLDIFSEVAVIRANKFRRNGCRCKVVIDSILIHMQLTILVTWFSVVGKAATLPQVEGLSSRKVKVTLEYMS